jgi:hypothetical protein
VAAAVHKAQLETTRKTSIIGALMADAGANTYISWSLAADVPVAKVSKMAGASIAQIESTYHRFLVGDEERYGSALDTFGVAV